MTTPDLNGPTLDPENWEKFRLLAHRMIDETLAHLQALPEGPCWQPLPAPVRKSLNEEPVPFEAQGEEAVFGQFLSEVRPHPNGSISPRHFGWVHGNSFPFAAMADMLASALNPHLAGYDQAPALVERKVVDWMRELMGFPEGSSGLLLSGGSMANFTALGVARNAMAGYDVRAEGVAGCAGMRVYGSSETHSWAKKAVEVLGLGHRAFCQVGVHADYTLNLEALKGQVRADREAGLQPAIVIGTAGTVNTGATDDLEAIADFCAEERLWFHVDGAFGALLALCPNYRSIVKGMARADSLAFDLHKWMYLPFDIACLLVRDGAKHRAAYSQTATYLAKLDRGVAAGGFPFADMGLELTRSFKALKAWMSIKAFGIDRFAEIIERNIAQAQYLAELVAARPELELLADTPLNIVCYRYVQNGLSDEVLDRLNLEVLLRLQEEGIAIPSSTVLRGRFAIRTCVVNHRTRSTDLDRLVEESIRLGREIAGALA